MTLIIRLQRNKTNKLISHDIVVVQKDSSSSSRYLQKVGHYNIHNKFMIFNFENYARWISNGALLSESVQKILNTYNVNVLSNKK